MPTLIFLPDSEWRFRFGPWALRTATGRAGFDASGHGRTRFAQLISIACWRVVPISEGLIGRIEKGGKRMGVDDWQLTFMGVDPMAREAGLKPIVTGFREERDQPPFGDQFDRTLV